MGAFRNVSIKRKLIAIEMLTSTVALLLACSAFGVYEVVMFRDAMTRDLSTLARIVGSNSTAALSFEDRNAAIENLAGLAAKRAIVAACIYDRHGRFFAQYTRDGRGAVLPNAPEADGGRFVAGGLRLVEPILLDRQKIGTIYIVSDLQEMYSRLQVYAAILALVLLAASALALLLSSRLQRLISEPILELTRVTNRIATQGDDAVRVTLENQDEFGQLAAAFNLMTARLQRSQSASEESLLRLAEAQRIARVGSWEWDIVANKVVWSDELYRLFGVDQQKFAGTYEAYLECVHPDDRPQVMANIEQALREKVFPTYCHRIVRPAGERIMQASGVVLTDGKGSPIKMTGVDQDVTEDKQMERELMLARDAALESARMKSEFLANMSHEIRTPMNGVIGMTELLLDTELTEIQREYTEMVRASAESLLGIISDILDFSKIEAGKLHFESIAFDLRATAEAAVDLLAGPAGSKGLELNLWVDDHVPFQVCGDPGRLQQVLTNLVSNAVKFTPAGEISVRCQQLSQTASHVVLRFSVADSGIGISEAARRILFQPFTQGDGSATRQYGGTGLGLVICRQLVELMGGEIGVESEPGRGSTFHFTVRLGKDSSPEAAKAPDRDELQGLRVLVVDDNVTNRKILMRQTAGWGMLPTAADSAAQGLQTLREALAEGAAFDIALLDLDMPQMNGLEMARVIQAEPHLAATRLILMPSASDGDVARAARIAGMRTCLRKPVRRAQLFDALVRVMRHSAALVEPLAVAGPADRPPRLAPDTRARVLIAEDNVINQTLAALQLSKLGYSSDVAANGKQALAIMFRAAYDIVLMDCQMPEMDGYQAAREIRRREGPGQHTVIIAMTAHSMAGDREKCLAAGMDDYLNKPVKMEDLRMALDRWQTRPAALPAMAAPAPIVPTLDAAIDTPHDPAIDLAVLDGLRALQDDATPDLLRNVITLFLTEAPAQLEAVRGAVEQQQALSLARMAHVLRGASANLGARGMAQTCAELEALGRAEEIRAAPVLVARLEAEFEHVRAVLSELAGDPEPCASS